MSISNGQSPKHTSLRRWFFVILYAIAGAAVAIPGALLINASINAILAGTEEQMPALAESLRYLTVLVCLWLMLRQARFRPKHFKNLWLWPPVTAAVPLGFWMLTLGIPVLEPQKWNDLGGWHQQNILLLISLSTSALVVALWLISKQKTKPKSTSAAGNKTTSRVGSFEDLEELPMKELLTWLDNESPVTHGDEDLFGAQLRAQRVFEVLQQKRPNPEGKELYKTAVIQGPFGSGKSTIVAFIEEAAKAINHPHHIFAHVNCWGFTSMAAQEHILDQAISQLSEHVDCLSLHHLPSAYADAISESSSWLAALASVMGSPSSPVEVLQLLTPILQAIEAHLIIIIEDTDRNSSDFDQKQVEAMLHSFRQVERVSFVLTAGNMSQIDFPKIAEHIQFVPRLPVNVVMTMMDRVRQHCRSDWEFIDPTTEQNRPERIVSEDREDVFRRQFTRIPHWVSITAALIDNPRDLKKTLSNILESWGRLHGEVDVDELIMLSVLRHTAPTVFDFLGIHRETFKEHAPKNSSPVDSQQKQIDERLEYLKGRWLKVVSDSGRDVYVLGKLLCELVYDSNFVTSCEIHGGKQRCQSIQSDLGDIYWERITSASLVKSELRDQEALKAIFSAGNDEGIEKLAGSMSKSSGFCELVLHIQKYSRPLDFETVRRVASIAIRKMRPMNYRTHCRPPRRYELVVELVRDACRSLELPSNWLLDELVACLPSHLLDADNLWDVFSRHFTDDAERGQIRGAFVEELKRSLTELNTAQFAQCFSLPYPWLLGHLVKLNGDDFQNAYQTGWSNWVWIGPQLISAMKAFPELMIPQVICAFGHSNARGNFPTAFTFDEADLKTVFGKQAESVLELLSNPSLFSKEIDEWMPGEAPLVAKEARRLLKEGWTPILAPHEVATGENQIE